MKKFAFYSITAVVALSSVLFMAFKPAEKTTTVGSLEPYILVEIYEIPNYKDKGIHIHYGGAKTEVIPFKEFKSDNHDDNADIILGSINKLVAMGFEIESTSAGMTESGIITKVFMRKRQ